MSAGSDDEEDFAFYGTPLDPIEEDAVPSKKPTPIEEQVVRDKQGRRRFHGAFTGGFSAGYCNTVGSEEGWTPSSFKSSRHEKASTHAQKPEDFMDEEDRSEFGFAPKVLRATSDYKQSSTLKRRHIQLPSGPIPGQPVLKEILQPAKETIGVRLLRSMGWRPGQGVGPRLNRLQKMKQKREIEAASKRVYGCTAFPEKEAPQSRGGSEESSDDSQDEDYASVLFAPHDYDSFLVKPKDDTFGIGYKGLDKKPLLSGHVQLFQQPSFLGMEEKKKKVAIWGQAFGVGALEEDDEDIYAKEDMSQYDFALETSATIAQRKKEEREAEHRRTLAKHDPGGHLDGFVPGKRQSTRQKKFFKPPVLPADFKPVHVTAKVVDATHNLQSNQDVESSKKRGLLRHEMRASTRASMLDEPLPVPPLFFPDQPIDHEVLKSSVGSSSSGSAFRPFASQPDKQMRYERFLDFARKGQKDLLSSIQPSSMTEWDKEHERSEFEQAARLYKPLSGVMSDRFVSASQDDDALNPLVPVERMKHGSADMQNAAKMKLFGKLTRTVTNWQPSALLCKRFNVPPPSGISDIPKVNQRKSRFSVFDFLEAEKENSVRITDNQHQEVEPHSEPHSPLNENMIVNTDENKPSTSESKLSGITSTLARLLADDTGKEQLEPEEKPDLFKAIFLSSSEESDSEEETTQGSEAFSSTDGNKQIPILRNMSPPRGIFANLDLDSLNASQPPREEKEKTNLDTSKIDKEERGLSEKDDDRTEDLMYGPQLPSLACTKTSSITTPHPSIPAVDNAHAGVWVERAVGKGSSNSCSEESSEPSDTEKKHSKSSSHNSRKDKHKKHSKHKKEKKHKKHKSKSKHRKRQKD